MTKQIKMAKLKIPSTRIGQSIIKHVAIKKERKKKPSTYF